MSNLAIFGGNPVRMRPFPSWPQGGQEEMDWVRKVLQGTRWFAGPRGDDPEALGTVFGKRFAELHGADFGLAVSNGSVAIEIALRALGISPGDEVILPSFTFFATASSVWRLGARPVFADIEPESFNLDPTDVAAKVSPRTRAIIPVHLFGRSADMTSLAGLASSANIPLVEDAAQAVGAECGGRRHQGSDPGERTYH